jgi:hypothetical protein
MRGAAPLGNRILTAGLQVVYQSFHLVAVMFYLSKICIIIPKIK